MLITASSLNTYTQCPRRYEYSYIKEKIPASPQAALLVGTAVHIGIEAFWNSLDVHTSLHNVWEFFKESDFWTSDTGRLEALKVKAYITGYYAHRSAMLSEYEVVAVEHEWTKVIDGISFAGKVDLVLRDKKGRLVLVDHKTSGSSDVENPGSSFWRGLSYDTQMILYREALSEIAESKGTPTLVYDVVRKTKSKPAQRKRIAKKKSETKFEYDARKIANTETDIEYGAKILRTYAEDDTRYIWREIPVTQDEAINKTEEILYIGKQMSNDVMYPRFQNSCVSRWGACPYFDVCCGTDSLESSSFKSRPAHVELPNQGEKNGK
tara:strand:- start:830 stop:1798 length:969 start_codon:yes stop_codon:yes gene_type:complete